MTVNFIPLTLMYVSLSFYSFNLSPAATRTTKRTRIQQEIALTKVPYHAVVASKGFFCSGGLIGSRTILTSAHCVQGERLSDIFVKVGAETLSGDGQIIKCIEVKIHEYFGLHSSIDNDIALVFLENHVVFSARVKKVIIFSPEKGLPNTTRLLVTGYATSSDATTDMEKLIWVIMDYTPCTTTRNYGLTPNFSLFCAVYKSHTCLSDSGGPGVVDNELIGILTTGASCGDDKTPIMFTNVSHYYKWIQVNVERLTNKYCNIDNKAGDYDSNFDD